LIMYTQFYGFNEKPFEITPDPRFLYLSRGHKDALAHLLYAVRERRGFTVITGEVGTGKTTLVQTLLSRLDGETRTAFIFNPKLKVDDFLRTICDELEIKTEKGSKRETLSRLHDYLMACYTKKVNVILIVDEAQALGPSLLEEVRLLTNLETPQRKLLQVILLGQPELDASLDEVRCKALKQRISVRYRMQLLDYLETREYIRRRIRAAGSRDLSLFTPRALKAIFKYSRRIPRLINIVCDNALLNGYACGKKTIDRKLIQEVVRDLKGGRRRSRRRGRWFLIFLLLAILLMAAAAIGEWREEIRRAVAWGWLKILSLF
jgi:general secretion pathway protein A